MQSLPSNDLVMQQCDFFEIIECDIESIPQNMCIVTNVEFDILDTEGTKDCTMNNSDAAVTKNISSYESQTFIVFNKPLKDNASTSRQNKQNSLDQISDDSDSLGLVPYSKHSSSESESKFTTENNLEEIQDINKEFVEDKMNTDNSDSENTEFDYNTEDVVEDDTDCDYVEFGNESNSVYLL
ncbi:hypothetical protein FQA39_LY15286 [Lamprigera yunnana]|nr:hypothetical protein FQA39_LY15286 [Lamprigera yunnana]